jgi:NADH:ubiquinone reductase (H+-translocating)
MVRSVMSPSLRRDLAGGIAAGVAGALLLHGMATWDTVRSGPGGPSAWALIGTLVIDLASGAMGGATFAAVFRYQPDSPAFSASGGLLFGLLWWILGPLTITPIWGGQPPSWSVREAAEVFPSLIGHVLYGAVLGLGFYTIVSLSERRGAVMYPGGRPRRRPIAQVVILGGGFAGVSTAQRLEQLLRRRRSINTVLVSQSNYLLFTPMLAEVAGGELEAQHIGVPLRATLPHTEVRRAEVRAIDTRRGVVSIQPTAAGPFEEVRYDHLVLALGSVADYRGLPGLEAHAFSLKTLDDAVRLRNHAIAMLERADVETDAAERRAQLTFVVAGAGFAGTELVTQLFDLIRNVRRFYQRIRHEELRLVLVHSGHRILPELTASLAAYALRKLSVRGIEVLLNTRVKAATADAVVLDDGRRVSTRTLVWTAGNRPHPAVRELACDRNRAGAVIDEMTLQVKGLPNVWGIGDCAEVPDLSNGGAPCPPTAQHAIRQGAMAAENLVGSLTGRPLRPFRYRTRGVLVGLGRHSAVADWRGRRVSGIVAWLMWRTVYLSKLPGLEKKIRVAADWTLDLFFPRDVVMTPRAEDRRDRPSPSDQGVASTAMPVLHVAEDRTR